MCYPQKEQLVAPDRLKLMHIYSVLEREVGPKKEVLLVKEGLCWAAFLFGPFWALANRMWITSLVLAAAFVTIQVYPEFWPAASFAQTVMFGLLLLGLLLHGGDLRQRGLETAGYHITGVVAGRNLGEAEQRLFCALGPLYDD